MYKILYSIYPNVLAADVNDFLEQNPLYELWGGPYSAEKLHCQALYKKINQEKQQLND